MSDVVSRPNKPLALLLAAACGIGVGHFYAGLRRRALFWLLFANVALLSGAVLVVLLGRTSSFGVAFWLLLGLGLIGWAAPLVDLIVLPRERFGQSNVLALLAFLLASIGLTVAARWTVRGFMLEAFRIPAGSMAPALLVGDHIFIDKLRYRSQRPERGDIAVFASPEHPEQDFVKRIVGLPGDSIEVRGGHLFVDGREVPRCSLGKTTLAIDAAAARATGELELERLDGHDYVVFHDDAVGEDPAARQGPWVVKPGEVFVLGDNRANSYDSRTWFGGRGGGVPVEKLKGRALGIWLRVAGSDVDWSRAGISLSQPVLPTSASALVPALDKCRRELPH